MKNSTAKVMAAFILGQLVQIILHTLSRVAWMQRPVLFCVAAGFLTTIAVLSGIVLEQSESGKPEHAKTYKEFAETPEKMKKEVERIFGKDGE